MALATVHSKEVVLLFLFRCLLLIPLFVEVVCGPCFVMKCLLCHF